MAEDHQASLEQYKIQLQQVEAALAAEPENEELLKLKTDLEEIINITQELIQSSSGRDCSSPASSGDGPGDEGEVRPAKPAKDWRVGDRCMAVWSKNSQYYEAIIDGISEGKAAVAFVGYNVTEMNKLTQLRPYVEQPASKKYVWDSNKGRNKFQADKERRRAKALKKAQRLKQAEEEKEADKKKWKEFATKAVAKSMKGVKRESIFASPVPDCTKGRVGVGTCGVSGRPMTKTSIPQINHHAPASSKINRSAF